MIERKTVTLVDNYEYICKQDAAVDRPPTIEPADSPETVEAKQKAIAAFDLKWEHYLDGKGPCPLVPGGRPTVFTLRHLNTVARGRLARFFAKTAEEASTWPETLVAAFALGLESVDGYVGKDGRPLKVVHELDAGLHACPVVSSASMNEFDLDVIMEVGARVMARSRPDSK